MVHRSVELFVRSVAPSGSRTRQEAVLERLAALAEADHIADYRLRVWGRAIGHDGPAARTEVGRSLLETVEAVRAWADEVGVSVGPFFETRLVEREVVEESHVETVLPVMLLVESVDGELQYVTPHERDGTVVTIPDRLDALAGDLSDPDNGVSRPPTA